MYLNSAVIVASVSLTLRFIAAVFGDESVVLLVTIMARRVSLLRGGTPGPCNEVSRVGMTSPFVNGNRYKSLTVAVQPPATPHRWRL